MESYINIRVFLNEQARMHPISEAEEVTINQIVTECDFAQGAVVLRNDGFANLIPDMSTHQEL